MAQARILRIYLEPTALNWARDGNFTVINRITSAFVHQDFRVELTRCDLEQRLKSAGRNGYSLFHMQDPFHDRALNLRRAYFYPFWRIENTAERWEFEVAKKHFDSGEIDTDTAQKWVTNWRKWIFKGAALSPVREGIIYVPLQGRLLAHRSFQTMSPVEMIEAVLQHDKTRNIVLGLHPNEEYTPKELAHVENMVTENSRLTLQMGGMDEALRICDYVVTQNSAAALSGYFFHKPAILFAKIDFHHLGLNVEDTGVAEAFERVVDHSPDYDEYLFWFIQKNAIKADEDRAEDDIISAARLHGWPV